MWVRTAQTIFNWASSQVGWEHGGNVKPLSFETADLKNENIIPKNSIQPLLRTGEADAVQAASLLSWDVATFPVLGWIFRLLPCSYRPLAPGGGHLGTRRLLSARCWSTPPRWLPCEASVGCGVPEGTGPGGSSLQPVPSPLDGKHVKALLLAPGPARTAKEWAGDISSIIIIFCRGAGCTSSHRL